MIPQLYVCNITSMQVVSAVCYELIRPILGVSSREIPEAEVDSVAEYLDRQLSCDVSWLPTEALTHNFWWFTVIT